MAWSSTDQNPTTAPTTASPSARIGVSTGYYVNPVYTPTGASTAAPPPSATQTGGSYSERIGAAPTPEPWETRETSRELATSADRTAAARRYTSEVSTTRGNTMQRQGERSLDLLHPQTVQRFALAAREARAEGIPVGIYSAYRPPAMGVGGFRDKYRSTHAYGLGFDVEGIGRPGSDTAKRWYEIATKYGLHNPYGPGHRKEWNHYQLVPERSANEIEGLRDTITGWGPEDPSTMWAASGVDPDGVPYAGDPFGVSGSRGRTVMAGGTIPSPRQRPQRSGVSMAYAPAPEAMEAPFDAVTSGAGNRRPQPATPRMRPQRDTLAAPAAQPARPQGGAYVVQRGDTLSAIAQRAFGDPNRWREIAAANGIDDPRRLMPGQRLVIPGAAAQTAAPARQPANVPQPRMRPSREVAMPSPRLRPERGANVPTPRLRPSGEAPAAGFDTRRLDDAAGPRQQRPVQSPTRITGEAEIRQSVEAYRQDAIRKGAQPGPGLDSAVQTYEQSLRRQAGVKPVMDAADIGRSVSEFRADLLRRGVPAGPRLDAAVNNYARRLQEQAGGGGEAPMSRATPAGPGMDNSGLIRVPTAEERALQGGARMRPPTGPQPMDPAVASQIRRTPVVITDPRAPPIFTSRSGVRIWAAR